jgi:hypothetical protein
MAESIPSAKKRWHPPHPRCTREHRAHHIGVHGLALLARAGAVEYQWHEDTDLDPFAKDADWPAKGAGAGQ